MSEILFVVGPTSVGKSRLALEFAERTGAEIVSADAFQVYDGLGLLTSRPGPDDLRRVPHHLFGTVPLTERFNVARYAAEAKKCLEDIRQRDRPALVVGGTGLYVKALTHGLSPLPAPDPALRAELESMELEHLIDKLAVLDPPAIRLVDLKNRRRVVRALEICISTGEHFSSQRETWKRTIYGQGEAGVFLDRDRDDLRARIDHQVEAMFSAGAVEEVRALGPQPVGDTARGVIGLSEILELIAGRSSLAQCKERVKTRTKQYAKRQITWFKREQIFRRVLLPADKLEDLATVFGAVLPV